MPDVMFKFTNLRLMRQSRGDTQADVARAANVERETVALWESGKRSPSDKSLRLLCEHYKVDASFFYGDLREVVKDLQKTQHLAILHQNTPRAHRTAVELYDKVFGAEEVITPDNPAFWKSDNILPFASDNCDRFWEFDGDEIVIRGPARCGKSTLILEYVIALMIANNGLQVLYARAYSVDLDAVRQNIRDLVKYRFKDPLSAITVQGGEKFDTLCIGDSRLYLKGIDRSEGQLGAGYDLCVFSQAEQIKIESVNVISSRVTPAGNNWIEDGRSRSLIIYDANHNRVDHWLEERIGNGLPCIEFDFTDHPAYFDEEGQETTLFASVHARLDKLDGVWRKRLLEGKAANAEGTIFELEDCHKLATLPNDFATANTYYRGMDFGMTDPNVCLWVSHHRQSGDLIVYQEWRRTKTDIEAMAEQTLKNTRQGIRDTIIDNDENRQSILRKHGIPATLATKGPNSVASGIDLINTRLRRAKQSEPGGLYFYNDPVGRDPQLVKDNAPLTIIDEAELYVWDNDKPRDKHNHAWDALRYIVEHIETMHPSVGFGSGAVKRQRRL